MVPSSFDPFFVASAGASGALVGLLFIAVSVSPRRIAGPGAPIERRLIAAAVFGYLTDAFFVALGSLIPGTNVGFLAIVFGVLNLIGVLPSSLMAVLRAGRLGRALRRSTLVAGSVIVYGWQIATGVQLVQRPDDDGPLYVLAILLLVLFGISLIRAWELLGATRMSPMAWASPLIDIDDDIVADR